MDPVEMPPQVDYRAHPNLGDASVRTPYGRAGSYDSPVEGAPVRPPDDADIHAYDLPDRPGIDRSLIQPTLSGFSPDIDQALAWERATGA